jgi:hypothetical protein
MEEVKWKYLRFYGRILLNSFLLALIFYRLYKSETISNLYLAIMLYAMCVCGVVVLEQWLSKRRQ